MNTFKTCAAFALMLMTTMSLRAQTNEDRAVGDFTSIRVSGNVQVELTQAEANSVKITSDANNVSKDIKTEVSNGVLIVSGTAKEDDRTLVNVFVKQLSSVDASGAAVCKSSNTLTTSPLTIHGTGASKIVLTTSADEVNVVSSGASDVKLDGTTKQLNVTSSGAASVKAYNLAAERAKVAASGASNVRLSAATAIDASASGSASVRYQGNPADKKVDATGSGSVSQRDGAATASDTTHLRIAGHDVSIANDPDDEDERSKREKKADDDDFKFWQGIDFGVAGYLSGDNKIDLPAGFEAMELNYGKSYVFGWNIFQKNMHIYRNNVNLATGIGLTWYHYNFNKPYTLLPQTSTATFRYDSLNFSKNRLNTCYVNVPLMLEFNTNNSDASKSFHIGGGVQVGYNLFRNKVKQKYELDGRTFKNTVKDNYNVNPFRFDAVARVGFGQFSLFGSYDMATLFENGKGPRVYPFTAGIHWDI